MGILFMTTTKITQIEEKTFPKHFNVFEGLSLCVGFRMMMNLYSEHLLSVEF